MDLIPSPSPSVKIQIMGGKVCLRCKGKILLGVVNERLSAESVVINKIEGTLILKLAMAKIL